MLVCTLVRLVVSACEWGGMLAGTLVYQPGLCGSRTGARIAWVQGWGTHIGSALPMTDEPLANVLGQACAISVRSAIVPGHVGLVEGFVRGSKTVVQLALSGSLHCRLPLF